LSRRLRADTAREFEGCSRVVVPECAGRLILT